MQIFPARRGGGGAGARGLRGGVARAARGGAGAVHHGRQALHHQQLPTRRGEG